MNETMYVKPAANRRVLDPQSHQPLTAEGAEVPRNTYWMRRLQDGDVTEATKPKTRKE